MRKEHLSGVLGLTKRGGMSEIQRSTIQHVVGLTNCEVQYGRTHRDAHYEVSGSRE